MGSQNRLLLLGRKCKRRRVGGQKSFTEQTLLEVGCHTSNFNPKLILVESTIHFIIVAEEFKCFTWTGRME